MYAQLLTHSPELPQEGQQVEFILDDREVAMRGIYAGRIFRTRWWSYEAERVRTWRSDGLESSVVTSTLEHAPLMATGA